MQRKGGDSDYDHIVPMVGYRTNEASGAITRLYFYDLYVKSLQYVDMDSEVKSRNGCRSDPLTYCLPNRVNYGIALAGFQDNQQETFPIEVSVPSWKEPDYSEEDQLFETPILFTASVTVSGLTSGQTYSVYRFDDRQTLPSSNFAREGYAKTVVFTATGSSYSFSDSFISSASVFYRAVL